MLDHFLTIGLILSGLFTLEIGPQSANHVHIQARNVIVVVANFLVLLLVLVLELFDGSVFLGFNLGDLSLSFGLHVLTKTRHLRLVLFLDLTGDTLMLFSLLCR